MRKQIDLFTELKEAILDSCIVIEEDDLNEWLKNLLKEFYNRNNKTFLTLTERETEALRKKYCDFQFNTKISEEYDIKYVPDFLRRTKRVITKRAILMYRLHLHNDAYLEHTDLFVKTVEELNRVGLKKISDITKLNEREFQIIVGLLPEKMQKELKTMLEKNELKLEGPEIVLEDGDVFIDEIGLSKTSVKCLFWSGIRTKSQIFNMSEVQMKRLLGASNKELTEIKNLFKKERRKPIKIAEEDIEINEETPLERLNLSLRAHQALYRNNIKTLGDLLNKPAQELRKLRGLGNKSYEEIIDRLKYLGYAVPKQQNNRRLERIKERIEGLEEMDGYLVQIRDHKIFIKKKDEK